MLPARRALGTLVLAVLLLGGGCAQKIVTVASVFPVTSVAAPWVLQGAVWNGTFEQAKQALGKEAATWGAFGCTLAWLAVYQHMHQSERTITVRAFAFGSRAEAQQAFEYFRPPGAVEFRAGDHGCWTKIGVLFVWGRLVFDIFEAQASRQSEFQAARFTGFIESHMPADLPDNPR